MLSRRASSSRSPRSQSEPCLFFNRLLVFNLLPVPPLDGSNIPFLFLSPESAENYREVVLSPHFRMIGLMVAWRIFGPLFHPIFSGAVHLLICLFPGNKSL
jgi:Zn-dependent protease